MGPNLTMHLLEPVGVLENTTVLEAFNASSLQLTDLNADKLTKGTAVSLKAEDKSLVDPRKSFGPYWMSMSNVSASNASTKVLSPKTLNAYDKQTRTLERRPVSPLAFCLWMTIIV